MAKRNETTGKKAATAASKVLRNPKSSAAAKSAAASALTQVAPTTPPFAPPNAPCSSRPSS